MNLELIVQQNSQAIEKLVNDAKDLSQLPKYVNTLSNADLLLFRIDSLGQTVAMEYSMFVQHIKNIKIDTTFPELVVTKTIVAVENTLGAFIVNNAEYVFNEGTAIVIISVPDGEGDTFAEYYLYNGGDKSLATSYDEFTAARIEWSNIVNKPTNLETVEGSQAKADAKVEDQIVEGVIDKAPSQNTVFNSLALKVDKIAGLGLSETSYTQVEKDKVAGLEGPKWKGTYINVAALETAYPIGEDGFSADVDAGAGANAKRYIWDDQEGWVPSTGEIAGETAESVRTKYLSNIGTEELTTALKTAYDNVVNWVSTNGQNILDHLTKWVTPTVAGKIPRTLADGSIEWVDEPTGSGVVEPNSDTLTTAVSITSATLTDEEYTQEGKTIRIANGVDAINYTVNGITASFIKGGTGTITFVQGAGRTLTGANGTLVFNGAVNSTASIVSFGTTDILYINNL